VPDNLVFNLQCDVCSGGAASAKKCMLRHFWLVPDELQSGKQHRLLSP
jgi:hypothetical protein